LRIRLRELGYVEGRNLTIDFVQDTDLDRLVAVAGEFARRGVDVLVTGGNDAVLKAAITATAAAPPRSCSGRSIFGPEPVSGSAFRAAVSDRQRPKELSQERDRWFESRSLQRRVCKPSVPQRRSLSLRTAQMPHRGAGGPGRFIPGKHFSRKVAPSLIMPSDVSNWATLAAPPIAAMSAVFATQIFTAWRDRHQRKAHAAYMAMHLAVILEWYATACSEQISRDERAQPPPDDEPTPVKAELPDLPSYPGYPEGWRSIDRKLAGKCLNFPNRIHESRLIIEQATEFLNWEDEVGDVVVEEVAQRGFEAWRLATALRQRHGLEKAEVNWDYSKHLEETLSAAKKARSERENPQGLS
jgi:hypothetical protein